VVRRGRRALSRLAGGFAAEQANPDPDGVAAAHRDRSGAAVLSWFDDARSRLLTVFRGLDPSLRVPWYGPPMSAASALTARIMETWAHGQDVADTLGVDGSRRPGCGTSRTSGSVHGPTATR
jgi:uncharacterized protein (TIGR03084 family)